MYYTYLKMDLKENDLVYIYGNPFIIIYRTGEVSPGNENVNHYEVRNEKGAIFVAPITKMELAFDRSAPMTEENIIANRIYSKLMK